MKRSLKIGWVCVLTLAWMTGCGSSSKSEVDPTTGEEMSAPEDPLAGTDAVPAESLESPPADALATEPPVEGDPLAQAEPLPEEVPAPAPTEDTLGGDSLASTEPPGAEPSPAQSTESAPSFSGTGATDSYSVQSGDTLMKVAFEVYGDIYAWKKIYELNRDQVTDPNRIPKGTTLKIEKPAAPVSIDRTGESYTIRSGDTLGKISSNVYGTPNKWRKIWDNNKQLIKDPNKIYAGFTLYYPMSPEDMREKEQGTPVQQLGGQPAGEAPRTPSSSGGAGN